MQLQSEREMILSKIVLLRIINQTFNNYNVNDVYIAFAHVQVLKTKNKTKNLVATKHAAKRTKNKVL